MTKTQKRYSYQQVNTCPQYNTQFPASFLQAGWNVELAQGKHGTKRALQVLARIAHWYGIR